MKGEGSTRFKQGEGEPLSELPEGRASSPERLPLKKHALLSKESRPPSGEPNLKKQATRRRKLYRNKARTQKTEMAVHSKSSDYTQEKIKYEVNTREERAKATRNHRAGQVGGKTARERRKQ